MPSKTELRRELLQARLVLSAHEVATRSEIIVEELKHFLEHSSLRSIHYFEPIQYQNEINIIPFLDFMQTFSPETTLHTSRKVNGQWCTVTVNGQSVAGIVHYDLVIVPMIAFDASFHRLGYGGGYYDRLLSKQQNAQKIGVCFELGKVSLLPSTDHDVPMDVIITERQVYVAKHPAPS